MTNTAEGKFVYKVQLYGAFSYVSNGVDLDTLIRQGLERGLKLNNFAITVEAAND